MNNLQFCNILNEIQPNLAELMQTRMDEFRLESNRTGEETVFDRYMLVKGIGYEINFIGSCFIWSRTEEGNKFWMNISRKFQELANTRYPELLTKKVGD